MSNSQIKVILNEPHWSSHHHICRCRLWKTEVTPQMLVSWISAKMLAQPIIVSHADSCGFGRNAPFLENVIFLFNLVLEDLKNFAQIHRKKRGSNHFEKSNTMMYTSSHSVTILNRMQSASCVITVQIP